MTRCQKGVGCLPLGGWQYTAESGNFYIESTKDSLDENGCFTGRIRINRLAGSTFVKTDTAFFRYLIPIGKIDRNRDIHTVSGHFRPYCVPNI